MQAPISYAGVVKRQLSRRASEEASHCTVLIDCACQPTNGSQDDAPQAARAWNGR
jgi:hypothetical protein